MWHTEANIIYTLQFKWCEYYYSRIKGEFEEILLTNDTSNENSDVLHWTGESLRRQAWGLLMWFAGHRKGDRLLSLISSSSCLASLEKMFAHKCKWSRTNPAFFLCGTLSVEIESFPSSCGILVGGQGELLETTAEHVTTLHLDEFQLHVLWCFIHLNGEGAWEHVNDLECNGNEILKVPVKVPLWSLTWILPHISPSAQGCWHLWKCQLPPAERGSVRHWVHWLVSQTDWASWQMLSCVITFVTRLCLSLTSLCSAHSAVRWCQLKRPGLPTKLGRLVHRWADVSLSGIGRC